MSDAISTFFEVWEMQDSNARRKKIAASVSKDIKYQDPGTPEEIQGICALNSYVGMFCADAPGWGAKLIASDTTGSITRATIAFSGTTAEGVEKVQYGQYFVEKDGDLIARMVGFVGLGK